MVQDKNENSIPVKTVNFIEEMKELDDTEKTGEWNSRMHFLFASVASAVGLGNVWRFPALLKIHGGGAFLLAYIMVILFHGIPMLYLEFSIGEVVKKNLLHVWGHVHPLATGIGYSCSSITILISSYYAVIIAWCLHYFLYSFQSPLPWLFCPINKEALVNPLLNLSQTAEQLECHKTTPEAYYWYRESLDISSGIESIFRWNIYLIILVSFIWFFVYLNLRNGIENASKIVYCTVIFPYISLVILLLRTVFIDGATEGLEHLFKPKWSSLGDYKLWSDAASQALFSISLGVGCMTIYGGMNRKKVKRSCLKDASIVVIVDTFTSMLGVFVVYSILGIRAHERMNECLKERNGNLDALVSNSSNLTYNNSQPKSSCVMSNFIEEAEGGTGLAFIEFTYTIAYLPGATLFSAVFFVTLFSLGFTSLVSFIVSANAVLQDVFKGSRRKQKIYFGIGSIIMIIFGAFFTQPSGEYFIQLFGSYGQDIPLLFIVLCEALAVAASRKMRGELRRDFKNQWLARLMEFLCCIFNPILITTMIIAIIIPHTKSGGKYQAWNKSTGALIERDYPVWANAVGLSFAVIPLLPLFIGFAYGIRIMTKRNKNPEISFNGCDKDTCNESNM